MEPIGIDFSFSLRKISWRYIQIVMYINSQILFCCWAVFQGCVYQRLLKVPLMKGRYQSEAITNVTGLM